jgi:hypothetical protein
MTEQERTANILVIMVQDAYATLAKKHNTTEVVIAEQLALGHMELNAQFVKLLEVGHEILKAELLGGQQ